VRLKSSLYQVNVTSLYYYRQTVTEGKAEVETNVCIVSEDTTSRVKVFPVGVEFLNCEDWRLLPCLLLNLKLPIYALLWAFGDIKLYVFREGRAFLQFPIVSTNFFFCTK